MKFAFYAERKFFLSPKTSRVIVLLGSGLRTGLGWGVGVVGLPVLDVEACLLWGQMLATYRVWSAVSWDVQPRPLKPESRLYFKEAAGLRAVSSQAGTTSKTMGNSRQTALPFWRRGEFPGRWVSHRLLTKETSGDGEPRSSPGRGLLIPSFYFQNEKWGTEGSVKNHLGRSVWQYLTSPRDNRSAGSESEPNQHVRGGPSSQWLLHCLPS